MLPYDYEHILEMFILKEVFCFFFFLKRCTASQRNCTKLLIEFLLGNCHTCGKQQKPTDEEIWQNICSFSK